MATAVFPSIPETITVHLGSPDSPAQNVNVSFPDYIKNVASSEIYPTWPESALRANILAIISFALNRIYTEHYRTKGYDFDITNTTQFDQAFVKNRDIFENISNIVDDIFNNYIVRQGNINPLFAQFCNGTTTTCEGLSQWGSVALAEQGLIPYEILQNYYGDDINIVQNAPVEFIEESYPGVPLKLGSAQNEVKVIQNELNRIRRNYPAIPEIAVENGVFGVDTEAAVKKFQEIFNLPQTGVVDKATWYKIKRFYFGVKQLSELTSEGITIEEAQLPFELELKPGSTGIGVRTIQYYLSVVGYFNPDLNIIPITGTFGEETTNAIKAFQQFYGLPVTGLVDRDTWNTLNRIYIETVQSLPPSYYGGRAKIYPGYFLTEGMQNEAVRDLQTYLSAIGAVIPELPELPVTGYFGSQTKNAVSAFQRLFGIPETGTVGAVTWQVIAKEYDSLTTPQTQTQQ